tara:strand:+ start:1868 stop:2335 length:468 start_codon:yes stop_codon:yes gene_type:complete
MKTFEQFKKDLSEMDRSIAGPGLVGAGLRGMLNVASGPLKKITSFASTVDDFVKRRKEMEKIRQQDNDFLKKVPDDPRLPGIEKDPEVKMHDRRPPDGSTPKDTSPDFQNDMRALGRGKNLSPEEKLEGIRTATGKFKKWKSEGGQGNKGRKPKK